MVTKEELIYRQIFTLKDGARVLIRPMTKEDHQALLELFQPVTPDELSHMRHTVHDPQVIASWIEHLDYDKVLPLVAVVGNRIIGDVTLHFHEGPARHRAEVRIFLAKDFRQRGVGLRMLQSIVELARRRSLYMLEGEVVSDQTHTIRAYQSVGFEIKSVFEDYFIMPDGELKDVAHLILKLRSTDEEF